MQWSMRPFNVLLKKYWLQRDKAFFDHDTLSDIYGCLDIPAIAEMSDPKCGNFAHLLFQNIAD